MQHAIKAEPSASDRNQGCESAYDRYILHKLDRLHPLLINRKIPEPVSDHGRHNGEHCERQRCNAGPRAQYQCDCGGELDLLAPTGAKS